MGSAVQLQGYVPTSLLSPIAGFSIRVRTALRRMVIAGHIAVTVVKVYRIQDWILYNFPEGIWNKFPGENPEMESAVGENQDPAMDIVHDSALQYRIMWWILCKMQQFK
jgi:hypothetical protein